MDVGPAPVVLFVALLSFEVTYWHLLGGPHNALERRLRALSPRNFYLVPVPYIIRFVVLLVYVTLSGAPVFAGLTEHLALGITVGLALAACQALVVVRRWPRLPSPPERVEVALFLAYTVLVVGLVEETIFRGALLLALGGGWLALLGSSVAMAVWHLPYYLRGLQAPDLARSLLLAFMVSLLFGVAVLATGSLWASILPHGLGDFVAWVGRRRRPGTANAAARPAQGD